MTGYFKTWGTPMGYPIGVPIGVSLKYTDPNELP